MQTIRGCAGILALGLVGCTAIPEDSSESSRSELGTRAPDPTGRGPLATTEGEYHFPAGIDPDVLDDRKTEIWAQVYRPATLDANEKHPLLVFLHGNHGTCGRGTNPRID